LKFYNVIPIVNVNLKTEEYCYSSEIELKQYSIVKVNFHNQKVNALVISNAPEPGFMCKSIEKVIVGNTVISEYLFNTLFSISRFYFTSMNKILYILLPFIEYMLPGEPGGVCHSQYSLSVIARNGELNEQVTRQSQVEKPINGKITFEYQTLNLLNDYSRLFNIIKTCNNSVLVVFKDNPALDKFYKFCIAQEMSNIIVFNPLTSKKQSKQVFEHINAGDQVIVFTVQYGMVLDFPSLENIIMVDSEAYERELQFPYFDSVQLLVRRAKFENKNVLAFSKVKSSLLRMIGTHDINSPIELTNLSVINTLDLETNDKVGLLPKVIHEKINAILSKPAIPRTNGMFQSEDAVIASGELHEQAWQSKITANVLIENPIQKSNLDNLEYLSKVFPGTTVIKSDSEHKVPSLGTTAPGATTPGATGNSIVISTPNCEPINTLGYDLIVVLISDMLLKFSATDNKIKFAYLISRLYSMLSFSTCHCCELYEQELATRQSFPTCHCEELATRQSQGAELILLTNNNNLILQQVKNPDKISRLETEENQSLSFPPFTRIINITTGDKTETKIIPLGEVENHYPILQPQIASNKVTSVKFDDYSLCHSCEGRNLTSKLTK
jgi:primosomal protein N'